MMDNMLQQAASNAMAMGPAALDQVHQSQFRSIEVQSALKELDRRYGIWMKCPSGARLIELAC